MKLKIAHLFIFTCLLTSCQNELVGEESLHTNRIISVQKMSGEAQQLAYAMLTKDEKAGIWINKLETQSKTIKYTTEQIALINELKEMIKSSVFKDHDRLMSFRDAWLVKAMARFDRDTIFELVFRINEPINSKALQIQPSNAPAPCDCHQGVLWTCGGVFTDFEYICQNKTCTKKDEGCGFLWGERCDGLCAYVN